MRRCQAQETQESNAQQTEADQDNDDDDEVLPGAVFGRSPVP